MLREMDHIAHRTETVQHNAAVLRQAQRDIGAGLDRDTILEELHAGRVE